MRPIAWHLLTVSLLIVSACAARTGRAEHPVSAERDGEAGAVVARSSAAAATRREMTWAEYYTEVAERARKHGIMVIWVNAPDPNHASAAPSHASADDTPR